MEVFVRLLSITLVLMALLQTTVLQNLSLNVEEDIKMANDNFLVKCTLSNTTERNVQLKWYNPNNDLIVESKFPSISIRNDGLSSKLILKELKTSDAGVYACRAEVNGKKLEANTILKIYRPLGFSSCKAEQQPIIYTDARIRCTATGDPAPKIQWRHKSKKIITAGRYEVQADGLVIKNITKDDNGEYILEAEIVTKSSYDEKSILVKVVVPPKISKPPEVSKPVEGSELSLSCKATGDPNPRYMWFKNNQELTDPRFEIDSIGGKLKVSNVKKSDGGKYKCMAINVGGNDTATAQVTILVPPTVEIPQTKDGKEGESITLVCKGKGVPVPSLTWQRSNDAPFPIGEKSNGVLVEETKNQPEKELTLTIASLTAEHADNYTCIGDNEAGNDAKRTYLRVEYKPVFINTPKIAYNWMGNKANITCTAKSYPKAIISWKRGKNDIGDSDTYKIFKIEGQEQMTSLLQVKVTPSNEKSVFTDYKCIALSIRDESEITIILKKAVVPKRPSKVNVLDPTPTTITLVINPPESDGGIPVTQYHITQVASGSETKTEKDIPVTEPSKPQTVILEYLTPNTKYQLKVFAGNRVGLSTTSVDLSSETPNIRAPFDVIITSNRYGTSPQSYRVTWDEPRTGGADIVSYSIQYRMVHITEKEPWAVDNSKENGDYMTRTVEGKTSALLTNLKADTHYEVQVVAVNKVGGSAPRPVIIVTKKQNNLDPEEPSKSIIENKEVPITAASTGISSGGVAGLIIALILIILIILDLICYFKFEKGVTMFLVSTCKKGSSAKDKSTDVEAGASQETTLLTDKQQKEEVEQAGEENKEAATEEGVTDEKKPLKNEDTDDDLKKDQTDKINTEDTKCEDIMSKES
ncbi:neural cell adhesion molecule 2 isoform X4 [Octopus sinensis]|uniref:Neural cell adhesion molecule 2 isoform X4 n=1 Tax=Octopus sinensis TaxID=2607531 RepID=A0A7E6FGQ6_9MOLL|nr:neural cell adhesion molecule 2 isoform X4 [Octopus sinensis]